MIFKVLGLYHPFFHSLIRRMVTVVVIAIWGLIEISFGNIGWAMFTLYLWIVCVLGFFIFPDPQISGGDDG